MAFLRLSAALILVLVALPAGIAQTAATGTVEGRVQNATNGLYVERARIRVAGTSRQTFTNAAGEYRLGVPAGDVTLEVFFTGLAQRQVRVAVAAGEVVRQDLALSRTESSASDSVVELDPYVVAANREYNAAAIAINEQRFSANKKDVVSTDAFGEISQGNIGEFVKHIPGISFELKDGNNLSGIMVRGFNSNYTNVTFNGAQLASAALSNTQNHTRQVRPRAGQHQQHRPHRGGEASHARHGRQPPRRRGEFHQPQRVRKPASADHRRRLRVRQREGV
ncbi:MAG TPA: carboxypeptidase regulatory-like domain-containing protein [Opitutus sp.]|nr:carboxypeptidase regulatory-like domain-containing protein [Opitutus sp.]